MGSIRVVLCSLAVVCLLGADGSGQFIFRVPAQVSDYYTGTLRTPSCSDASIDSAITASSSGDIVRMESACSSMTVSNTIPNTKGILFDGNGSTFSNTSSIRVTANSTTSTRITNFTMGCGDTQSGRGVNFSADLTDAKWRMDHATFTGSSHRCLVTDGAGYGLVDNNTWSAITAAQEFIHNEAHGTGSGSSYSLAGWDTALTPGTGDQIYYEDNTFTCASGCSNPGWIQSYYGARVVTRFNTHNYIMIDNHGTAGNVGGRWWEAYGSVWNLNGGTNFGRDAFNLRAGSGLVFDNSKTSGNIGGVGLCEEDTGYPAAYQIGRGEDGTLVPAYIWSNGTMSTGECSDAAHNGTITDNVDYYTSSGASCTSGGSCTSGVGTGTTLPTTCTTTTGFWKSDEGGDWNTSSGGSNDGRLYTCTSTNTWSVYYTPYTYPHPLQAGLEPDK
jgi:hypothetical protein